jgi:hypothetical protein
VRGHDVARGGASAGVERGGAVTTAAPVMVSQACYKSVTGVLKKCYKNVTRVSQECQTSVIVLI